jgi:hypothetical protein
MTRHSSIPPDPVRRAVVEEVTSHPVFEDLVHEIVTSPLDTSSATAARTRAAGRLLSGRRSWLAAGVAVAAVLGAVLPIVLTSGGGLSHAITTRFETAKPFTPSSSSSGSPLRSGKWQLTGALLSGKWNQNTEGPPPGSLTCASTTACYDLSGYYTSARAGQTARYYSLYVTTDLGRTWSVLAMPAGFQASTPLSCPAPSTCAVGGTLNGQPAFLASVDGGSQWTITPLTGLPGELVELVCSSAAACHGVVGPPMAADAAPGGAVETQSSPLQEVFVTTANAGRTWESSPLPATDLVYGLACPDAGRCVVIGSRLSPDTGFPGQADFVRSTADGGVSWETGSLPAGFTLPPFSDVSCANAENCLVLGNIPLGNTNPPQCAKMPGLPAAQAAARRAAARRAAARGAKLPTTASTPAPVSPAVEAISKVETALALQADESEASQGTLQCSYPGSGGLVSDIAASTDGGLTWTPEALPGNVPDPQLDGVSCPSATECWAAGSESIVQHVGGGTNDSSSVLLGTTDGGTAWSKVVFSVPNGAPDAYGQSYLSIGDVDCPAQGVCMSLGVAAQSSPTAPVYSLVSTPSP